LNVNPLEIENEIRKINSVRDAFVFGERDDFWGQMVCAAVESDEKLSAEEIRVYLKGKLAAYKIPKKFFFVKKLPRTELGKIRKEELLKIIQQDDF
jgi:acyl-CoA synthetase (AMP-forming)/AMP-acid ligase II